MWYVQGGLLVEYSQNSPWLCDFLEATLSKEGVSGIFKPYEPVQVDMSNPIQAGIYAHMMAHPLKRSRPSIT